MQGQGNNPSLTIINLLLAHSTGAGGHFSLYHNTTPFRGYHLAHECINGSSSLNPAIPVSVDLYLRMMNLSLQQWHNWSIDFGKAAMKSKLPEFQPKPRLRIFAGEPCAFMLASSKTKLASNLIALYSRPWTGEKLKIG